MDNFIKVKHGFSQKKKKKKKKNKQEKSEACDKEVCK